MATMKSYAAAMHAAGKCNPDYCLLCDPSLAPGVHDRPQSVDAPAPTMASPGGEGSLERKMYSHMIRVLRNWGEDDLAMAVSNTIMTHDPKMTGAVAAGWMDR